MQILFTMLLTAILVVAMISFAFMAIMRLRRSRAMARQAHELNMRFSASDPLDIARRYANFALVSGGHSPKANNVTFGRMEGRRVSAFDFRYEVGHGTRRLTRHYTVVTVESVRTLPNLIMWNDDDVEAAPLEVRTGDCHLRDWACAGEMDLAAKIASECEDLREIGMSFQVSGTNVMMFAPANRDGVDARRRLAEAVRVAEMVEAFE